MDGLRQDVLYALRTLRRSPGFTLVAALTLALGIGANTAIFSVIQGWLLRPLPYPQPDRLVRLYTTSGNQVRGSSSGPDFLDILHQTRSFAAVAAVAGVSLTLTGAGEPERLQGQVVSAEYFRVLGVAPALGRTPVPGAGGARQAVLSWKAWRTYFGGQPGILGRTITLNGEAYAVVGVMPAGYAAIDENAQLWTLPRRDVPDAPLFGGVQDIEHQRGARYLDVLARLRPGVTLGQAQAELRTLSARLAATYPDANGGQVFRALDWHEDLVGEVRRPLLLLLGAVAFVLLIACANIANLLLTRGAARQREVTVRRALGASRRRIARQFLTESVVLGAAGGVAGLGLAYATLGPVTTLLPVGPGQAPDFARTAVDARVLAFTLAVSLLAGLLAGVAPALLAGRLELARGLREGSRGSTEGAGRHRLRAAFVVAQVALSLVLVVGAGLLVRSFARLTATDPGFDRTRVLTVALPLPETHYSGDRVGQFYDQALARIRALPGVQEAGAVFGLPLTGVHSTASFVVEGRPAPPRNAQQTVGIIWATGGYYRALRIPLVAGRLFDERDAPSAPAVVVINQALARRYWPGQDPVGRRVKLATDPADTTSPWMTVVGVAGNVRPEGLDVPPAPELALPLSQNAWSRMILVVRTTASDPRRAVPAARRAVHELDPTLPLGEVGTLDAVVERSLDPPRFRTVLLGAFALLALLLAAVGIYGVVSFGVTQRRPEIGVRLALGATPGDVRRLVVGQGLRPVLIGLALGLAGALAGARALRGLLYDVPAWDPFTLIAVTALLTAVALLASWLPARRAAAIDPMVSLRTE